jgi:hypothetical protein
MTSATAVTAKHVVTVAESMARARAKQASRGATITPAWFQIKLGTTATLGLAK